MTFEEAKKILEKEFAMISLHKSTEPFEFDESGWIEYEKPSVLEAFRVLSKEGYYITISGYDYDMRKKRLKKEYETSTKAPGPGEEQPKEGNPALEESASQFNDALLDEQAKKIAELTKEKANLEDQITVLNACKKHNDKIDRKQIKCLGKEIAKLNGIIHDKNAILSDVAEELRLSKIREKNLVEVSQKYMKENEELKKKLEKMTKLVETVRKGSKEYCEYGIAAEKMIQKMAKDIVYDRPVSPKDYEQYRHWAKGYRFNPQLPERTDEEEKKPNTSKSTLDDLKEKDYNSFNAKAHNLGLVGNKDGNGIIDQMIGVDIAEKGGDHSAIIAQCCKNIAISKVEAEIIERCTKNGTELHYSEKDGFTYTNMFGDELPIICLRGMCQVFTDEEIKNMKK